MTLKNKSKDAVNTLTYDNTTYNQHNTALNALQELREIAWQQAIKYRWDPVLSQAHEEYLKLISGILGGNHG